MKLLPILNSLYGENQVQIQFKGRRVTQRELEQILDLFNEDAENSEKMSKLGNKGTRNFKR